MEQHEKEVHNELCVISQKLNKSSLVVPGTGGERDSALAHGAVRGGIQPREALPFGGFLILYLPVYQPAAVLRLQDLQQSAIGRVTGSY